MVEEEKGEIRSDNEGTNDVSVTVTETENNAAGSVDRNSAGSSGVCVRKYLRRKSQRLNSSSCSKGIVLQDSRFSTNLTTDYTDKVCALSS